MSITDEESGITALMRVEETDGVARVTRLQLDAADGFGITSEDLRLLRDFGLQLPPALVAAPTEKTGKDVAPARKSPPKVTAAPAPRQRVAPAAKRTAKAAKATPGRKRYENGVPSDAVLQSFWLKYDGSATRIAETLGCSAASVYGWIKAARARGVDFTLADVLAGADNNEVGAP